MFLIPRLLSFRNFLFFGLLFLFLVVMGLEMIFEYQVSQDEIQLPVLAQNEVRVFFDFGNGQKRIFDGPVIQGMSALDALRQSAKAGNFSLEFVAARGRVFIGAINGLSGQTDAAWHFYLNGREVDEEILDMERIRSGDVIVVRYLRD